MTHLPSGTVTFLFTDIEGSTKLAREHPDTWESARARQHTILRSAIEACQLLGQRGILLTQHPEQLPAQLPQGIQHFTYVPFSTVLPRALALVFHGGIGTTAQAIAAGIPQVIRPMAYDQPDTAARVEKLGIGVSLDPKKFNASSLAEKLNNLITSQAVLDRCKFLADKIHPEQALTDTCAIIEDFSR